MAIEVNPATVVQWGRVVFHLNNVAFCNGFLHGREYYEADATLEAKVYSKARGAREVSATVLEFNTTGAAEWGTKNHGYHRQAEWFAVYSPDTGKGYMISLDEIGKNQTRCSLRLEGSLNNQEKSIKWAKDYEL